MRLVEIIFISTIIKLGVIFVIIKRCIVLYILLLVTSVILSAENIYDRDFNLTEEEYRYLESHPTIKVANEMDWPPFDYNEFGKPKGLSIDYIKLVCSKIGLEIEFIYGYTWTELLQMFENRELDVIPAIYKNKERERYTLYTEPYYTGKLGLFTRQNYTNISTQNHLIGKRVGIQTSHGSIPHILAEIPGITLIELDTTADLVKDLALNRLDAIIGNPLLFYYNSREYQITNIELKNYISFEGYDNSSTYMHIGVRKDKPILYRILDKINKSITEEEKGQIIERWTRYNYEPKTQLKDFTETELEYLKNNNLVLIAEPNRMPYQGFDKDGNLTGIVSDYIKVLEGVLEYKFKVIPTDTYFDYQTQLDRAFTGIHLCELNNRSSTDLYSTYINSPIVISTNNDQLFIEDFSDYVEKKVSVIEGSNIEEQLLNIYPNINIIPVKTVNEGLIMVQNREVFGYIDSAAVIGHAIQKNLLTDIKITGTLNLNRQMVIKVNDKNSMLYNIVEKSMTHISSDDKRRIYNKWVAVKYEKGTDYTLVIRVITFFLIILIISLVWNRKLIKSRKETRVAIEALNIAHKALEIKNSELKVLSITDSLTGLSNRLQLDEVLRNEIIRYNRTADDLSVIMIDIDFFKRINDKYGHLKGDKILKDVALTIKNSIRVTDHSGRWGGEEFLIICPNTDIKGARTLAEKIRVKVELYESNLKPGLTISLGVTQLIAGDSDNNLINRVDEALYRAKNSGRNRVEVAID